jgi:3-hydroxybutyryl-CoA dehydrogenase
MLGVVGAGTMGAGIAQLGVGSGMRTLLHDPIPEALEKGAEKTRAGLSKWAERGRDVDESLLETVSSLDDLAGCELIIEAAPERLDLKRELFGQLSRVAPDAVLASNTSSIPITSIASAAERPENVVGMHFFNPPPLMKLIEVIAADQSGERALQTARAACEAMGNQVIDAIDGPGFLVNRCGRPYYAEALRLLQERTADHEQIDRICRMAGGFRMGPFELMDLVGIDTGFEVSKSFKELSFGEPRWLPNPIQARLVAAGRLGRKSGRGYYDYSEEPYRPEDPQPPEPGGGDGRRVLVRGDGPLAEALREHAGAAGFELGGADPWLTLDADPGPGDGRAHAVLCADLPLAGRAATGFHLTLPLGALVELTGESSEEVEEFFAALGFAAEWVGDAPGLVLGRIVCQLVNEAAFAIGEGVGSPDDVDAGLRLGLNHPRGPVEWGSELGIGYVLAVVDGLYADRHEDRYRAAPLLRRAATLGEWPPPT